MFFLRSEVGFRKMLYLCRRKQAKPQLENPKYTKVFFYDTSLPTPLPCHPLFGAGYRPSLPTAFAEYENRSGGAPCRQMDTHGDVCRLDACHLVRLQAFTQAIRHPAAPGFRLPCPHHNGRCFGTGSNISHHLPKRRMARLRCQLYRCLHRHRWRNDDGKIEKMK